MDREPILLLTDASDTFVEIENAVEYKSWIRGQLSRFLLWGG